MYTTPSPDDLLEGVILSLQNDILPMVPNAKAQAAIGMMQAVLQTVRQTIPVYQQLLADEHNAMTRVLRDVAGIVGETPGPAADALRQRAQTLGARPDLPAPDELAGVMAAHRELTESLVATVVDIDALQREGHIAGDAALTRVREHAGATAVRDVQVMSLGGGLIGRN
jgi:hypothetical protein